VQVVVHPAVSGPGRHPVVTPGFSV
jgi:hypothetical protein